MFRSHRPPRMRALWLSFLLWVSVATAAISSLDEILGSLVVLSSSSSLGSPSCAAFRVEGGRFLTGASCMVGLSLDLVQPIDHAPIAVTANQSVTILWADGVSQLLSLEAPSSGVELLLPRGQLYPALLDHGVDVSIVEINLDTGNVTLSERVIFVDQQLCLPNATEAHGSEDKDTVCVLPLDIDRRSDISTHLHRRVQRFMINHDTAMQPPQQPILLGVGLPIDAAQEADGFRLFSWLQSSFRDPSFGRLWSSDDANSGDISGSVRPAELDRVLGSPVTKKDRSNDFIAAVRLEKETGTICTGSLIAPRFVLTAAHCAYGGMLQWVAIGSLTTSGSDGEIIRVVATVRPTAYSPQTITHDYMLLELAHASSRTPIRVSTESGSLIDTRATVMGYGVVGVGIPSTKLRTSEVPIGPATAACAAVVRMPLDETHLCAGGDADAGACHGDSGGPLVLDAGTKNERLVAIVSRGRGCGAQGDPTVYMRVRPTMFWTLTFWTSNTMLP